MSPFEDSGQIPLTRDRGKMLIREEIEKFEGNVWMPAMVELRHEVKMLTRSSERLRGALWVILGTPALAWTILQIYQAMR